MSAPHVAIAGAGYAGLSAYLALRPELAEGRVSVTVVNATDAHLLLPELPLFLTGRSGPGDVRIALTTAVRPPARVLLADVAAVDPAAPAIRCKDSDRPLAADGLILALGSVTDDFGVPGVAEHAIAVGRWEDAVALRLRLMRQYRRRAAGRVAVVGGGFTGVEIAAALASTHGRHTAVALVAPSILPAMPEQVQSIAAAALRRLHVEIIGGTRATAVEGAAVVVDGGRRVPADTVIWAAGVRGNPVVAASGLPANRRGQAVVDATLRVAPRVYCAGDCAATTDAATGRPVARTAQAAMAEGALAARNLLHALRGQETATYTDRSLGFLVSLGAGDAAGLLAGHVLHGREVAALKRLIETYHAFHTGGLRALGLRLLRAGDPDGDEASAGAAGAAGSDAQKP